MEHEIKTDAKGFHLEHVIKTDFCTVSFKQTQLDLLFHTIQQYVAQGIKFTHTME